MALTPCNHNERQHHENRSIPRHPLLSRTRSDRCNRAHNEPRHDHCDRRRIPGRSLHRKPAADRSDHQSVCVINAPCNAHQRTRCHSTFSAHSRPLIDSGSPALRGKRWRLLRMLPRRSSESPPLLVSAKKMLNQTNFSPYRRRPVSTPRAKSTSTRRAWAPACAGVAGASRCPNSTQTANYATASRSPHKSRCPKRAQSVAHRLHRCHRALHRS